MNSSTRLPRCEVVDLCETIHASGPLPVFGARVLGLFVCVRLTLILAAPQPAPGAARRALLRLAGHRLPCHRRLHAPDRPRPQRPGTSRGGPGPHRPADHRRHPTSVLVLGRPSRAVLLSCTGWGGLCFRVGFFVGMVGVGWSFRGTKAAVGSGG